MKFLTVKMQIMFSSISWTEYLVVIVLLLIVYYIIVVFKFYSFELQSILKGKTSLPVLAHENTMEDGINRSNNFQQSELFPSYQRFAPQVQETDDTFQQVEELTTKLKDVIADAASNNSTKDEFFLSLQLLLSKYHFLKGSPFPVAINNLIASECEKFSFTYLSAEERVMLWNE
jgi:hypothetical protein